MAFWKKIFKSKYTGAEIDAAIRQTIENGAIMQPRPETPSETLIIDSIKVGDNTYIPACRSIEHKKIAKSVGNGTVLTKQEAVTPYVTFNDGSGYSLYPSDLTLVYTPSPTAIQSLVTTGSASETIDTTLDTEEIYEYKYVNVGMGGSQFIPLFYSGTAQGATTYPMYTGVFATKNDTTFGTAIIQVTVTIMDNPPTNATIATKFVSIPIS